MEANDLFADHVHIGRPILFKLHFIVAITNAGHVAGQGVIPDIDDMFRVARPGNPPLERPAADGDVLEAALHKTDNLVAAKVGLHEFRMLVVQIEQALLERRELEEVVFFGDEFGGTPAGWAVSRLG